MLAYKAFRKGLNCRGYQFHVGFNFTEEANCVRNGFHCVENPIDCLTYYPNVHESEYWIVDALGDIDEDARDSKISCTILDIKKKLTLQEYFLHCLLWLVSHPEARASHVAKDHGQCFDNGYAIVVGKFPVAKGKKEGDILALLQVDTKANAIGTGIYVVGTNGIDPGKYYDIHGKEYQYV